MAWQINSIMARKSVARGERGSRHTITEKEQGKYHYVYGPYAKPVLTVDPGAVVSAETHDAFEGAIKNVTDSPSKILNFPFLNPQNGPIFVNGAEKGEVLRVDARRDVVDARWPVADCVSPHGLAIDRAGRRLFVSCENRVLKVLDSGDGAVVATVPIGAGSDAVAFDPVRHRVFGSNFDGTLTVISQRTPDSYAVLDDLKTQVTGRTMTLDPRTGRLYLAAARIDASKAPPPRPDGRPGRPVLVPGSLALLMYDPVR